MMNSNNIPPPQEASKLIAELNTVIQDIRDMDMSKFTDEKFCKNLYEDLNFLDISKDLNRMMYYNYKDSKTIKKRNIVKKNHKKISRYFFSTH